MHRFLRSDFTDAHLARGGDFAFHRCKLGGEQGYWFTSLVGAVHFLMRAGAKEFGVSDEAEFAAARRRAAAGALLACGLTIPPNASTFYVNFSLPGAPATGTSPAGPMSAAAAASSPGTAGGSAAAARATAASCWGTTTARAAA